MTRFLVFALLLALVSYWLHRRLVRATGVARPWSIIVDIFLGLLWVLAMIGVGSGELLDPSWARTPGFAGWVWLGTVFYLVLGLAIIGLASLVARMVRRLRGSRSESFDSSRRRAIRIATVGVVIAAVATTSYGVVEAVRPEVVRVTVPLAALPDEFDGLRVALISDLHVGPTRGGEFTARVVETVNAERPDLIAIAGDLVDGLISAVRVIASAVTIR